MEILGWIILIVVGVIVVWATDYFSTWGGQGYSDYQIDKMNKEARQADKLKWRKEVEYKLQNNLIDHIPINPFFHGLSSDDNKWEEEMKRKYGIK